MISFDDIPTLLADYDIDGWLIYDYRRSNPIAHRILGLRTDSHVTRRFALWIPRQGSAVLIASAVETHLFEHLPFERRIYRSRIEWVNIVHSLLRDTRRIAVEYSPHGDLPSVSYLDAGTAELIRSFGVELVSSADLVQHVEALWTAEQIAENRIVAEKLHSIMMESIEMARSLARLGTATEYDLQQFVRSAFDREQLVTDHPPIVAIGSNTASPHYEPTALSSSMLQPESMLLLDMWAKGRSADATYADITWTVWLGNTPPDDALRIAHVVIAARDAALSIVRQRMEARSTLRGYEVDDVARATITAAGYGEYFVHRTGHNIGTEVHGYGANMDNYETCDTRRILPGTSFSVELGIYLSGRFGFRSECDVVIDLTGQVHIPSEPLQRELLTIDV
jgi:Xaa-Pro aminopeptidase